VRQLHGAGAREVAIERPDGPVVDVLLEAGFGVIVIAPNQLKNLRSRYGSAGNKDDGFDAYVLADTLRTDRARLRPLTRDSDATLTLRFLTRFPSQDKADWLSWARLGNWLRSVGYNRMHNLDLLWHHLHDAPRGTTGPEGTTRAHIALALVAGLTTLPTQINALEDQIADQLAAHPDAAIFTSLPRSGTVRAARLLAEIRDARGRFPTPEALTCLAGAAPSTRQSGKLKIVAFRWAVDKQLRGVVIDFAGDSHHANPWAADLYQRARARGHDHPHAVRILARAWLQISGAAGKTACPTTLPNTAHYNAFSTRRLDTGLLMPESGIGNRPHQGVRALPLRVDADRRDVVAHAIARRRPGQPPVGVAQVVVGFIKRTSEREASFTGQLRARRPA
jgi:transposase